MIEFHHVVNRGEVKAYYLNLTDDAGQTYGRKHFPPDRTRLVIRDGRDRDIQAKMRGRNQIWGALKKWFQLNEIRSGARIVIRFNPDEREDGHPVVHLIPDAGPPVMESREPVETMSAPPAEGAASEFPINLEGQTVLARDELKSLIEAFGAACRSISDLRARCSVAKYVQYPKIPTILSESLAVHAITDKRLLVSAGPFTSVKRGGREADIIAINGARRPLMIEIKASGEENFATFGRKDYSADFLLWLQFGRLLRESRLGKIEVLVCPRPADHLPWWAQHMAGERLKDRVTVAQLTHAWDGQLDRVQLDLDTLLCPNPRKL